MPFAHNPDLVNQFRYAWQYGVPHAIFQEMMSQAEWVMQMAWQEYEEFIRDNPDETPTE